MPLRQGPKRYVEWSRVMASLARILRLALGAWVVALTLALAMPVQAQQPSSVNPTASSVKEAILTHRNVPAGVQERYS